MTIKSNLDAAVVDLKSELDSRSFLDPGAKEAVDNDLISDIQTDMDSLVTDYDATFLAIFGGDYVEVIPTAEMLAHWLFDGESHQLKITLYPTNLSEGLEFTSDVPFPWRS